MKENQKLDLMIKEGRLRVNAVLSDLYKLWDEANCSAPTLIGGAVLDIIECRKPKDYDFINHSSSHGMVLQDNGWELTGNTTTAMTYIKDGIIVQLLKTHPIDFDFTISLASYNPYKNSSLAPKSKGSLIIDHHSYYSKVLIPCELAFKKRKNAWSTLYRIPHYQAKGYTIPTLTYHSLLSVLGKDIDRKATCS